MSPAKCSIPSYFKASQCRQYEFHSAWVFAQLKRILRCSCHARVKNSNHIKPANGNKACSGLKLKLGAGLHLVRNCLPAFALIQRSIGGTGFMPRAPKTSSSVLPATCSPARKRPYSLSKNPCSMARLRITTLKSLDPVK